MRNSTVTNQIEQKNRFEHVNVANSYLREVWKRITKHTLLLEQEPLLPSAAVAISDLFHCAKKHWKKATLLKYRCVEKA